MDLLFHTSSGMYGFQKLVAEGNPDRGAYFSELFLRGRPGLARGIMRLKHVSLIDPNNEPNLHLFPPMPPTPVGPDEVAVKQVVVSSQSKSLPRSVISDVSPVDHSDGAMHHGISSTSREIPNFPSIITDLHNDTIVPYVISPSAAGNITAISDVPPMGFQTNETFQYGMPPNVSNSIAVLPNAPRMAIHTYNNETSNFLASTQPVAFVQASNSDHANVSLLQRIKQNRKQPSNNHNPNENITTQPSQDNSLVQWVANTTQMNTPAPLSYIIMRVGNF